MFASSKGNEVQKCFLAGKQTQSETLKTETNKFLVINYQKSKEMTKIALKLKRKNADALITFALDIHARMLENAVIFSAPPVALSDFKTSIDALQTAQNETLMGGKATFIIRNEKQKQVCSALGKLANYVENVADGDATTVALAGMSLKRRGPGRYTFLDQPVAFRGIGVGNGRVALRWKKVDYTKAYEVEYCADPIVDDKWQQAPLISASNTIVDGLIRKEDYWFRVRACGSKGLVSEWSNPLKVLVL
jgi:hypothetical protein